MKQVRDYRVELLTCLIAIRFAANVGRLCLLFACTAAADVILEALSQSETCLPPQ